MDERLAARHSDLLFRVRVSGQEAFLDVLFEHQSSVDPLLVVRLLVYMARIWDEWLARHEGATRVPPILPLVLYQGPTAWTAATSFHEVIDLDADALALVREHVPDFRVALDDLATQSDAEVRARDLGLLARVALLLLRHLREARTDPTAIRRLAESVADLFRAIPRRVDRTVVIAYVPNVADADRAEVEAALADAWPELREDVVTVADQLRREGQLEGERSFFLRLLGDRFPGQVTPEIERRIRAADRAQLDAWGRRAFVATGLDAVFSTS